MRALLFLTGLSLAAQSPILLQPGITQPRVLKHVAPSFPVNASELGHERSVVFEITIDTTGKVDAITPLHPAGFGFDEAALSALRKWRFAPATKDGQPIAIRTTVEMSFALPTRAKSLKRDYNYQTYNAAITAATNPDPAISAKGLESLHALSTANFPPAQFTEGVWRIVGNKLPADPAAGIKLVLAAVEQNYPAAVGQAGIYYYEGRHVPMDKEKGIRIMKSAATQGAFVAQLYLGDIEPNPDSAAYYFRLCAAKGQSTCQTRFARYLLQKPRAQWPEAIAWLRLASQQNHAEAKKLLAKHEPELTDEERRQSTALRLIPGK